MSLLIRRSLPWADVSLSLPFIFTFSSFYSGSYWLLSCMELTQEAIYFSYTPSASPHPLTPRSESVPSCHAFSITPASRPRKRLNFKKMAPSPTIFSFCSHFLKQKQRKLKITPTHYFLRSSHLLNNVFSKRVVFRF